MAGDSWLDAIKNPDGVRPPWPPQFGFFFEREFRCVCGNDWVDVHDCDCNDRCPACGLEIEPSLSRRRHAVTGRHF